MGESGTESLSSRETLNSFPFVLSLSKHDLKVSGARRLFKAPFDKLRANGSLIQSLAFGELTQLFATQIWSIAPSRASIQVHQHE